MAYQLDDRHTILVPTIYGTLWQVREGTDFLDAQGTPHQYATDAGFLTLRGALWMARTRRLSWKGRFRLWWLWIGFYWFNGRLPATNYRHTPIFGV